MYICTPFLSFLLYHTRSHTHFSLLILRCISLVSDVGVNLLPNVNLMMISLSLPLLQVSTLSVVLCSDAHRGLIYALSWSHDSHMISTASADGIIKYIIYVNLCMNEIIILAVSQSVVYSIW